MSTASAGGPRTPEETLTHTVPAKIYLDRNRANSERLLRRVEKDGYNGIMLTVDSAVPGKRERDQRAKGDFQVREVNRDAERLRSELNTLLLKAPATSGADGQGALGVAQVRKGFRLSPWPSITAD